MRLSRLKFDLNLLEFGRSKNKKSLKPEISRLLRIVYYLLKKTDYNINPEEFHYIYSEILTFDVGDLIKEYYKIKEDRIPYDIMKIEYIKYFDNSKSCILNLKNNKEVGIFVELYYRLEDGKEFDQAKFKFIKTEVKPDISVLQQGLNRCHQKTKYNSDNILCNLFILMFVNDKLIRDAGHANTILFNKSKREIYRVEPNYLTQTEIDNFKQEAREKYEIYNRNVDIPLDRALTDYFKGVTDYNYKGYYIYNDRSFKDHAGFCNFLAVLIIYTNVKLNREIVKEKLLDFIKWEYTQFSGKLLNENFNNRDFKKSVNYLIDLVKNPKNLKVDDQPVVKNNFKFDNFNKVEFSLPDENSNLNFKFEF